VSRIVDFEAITNDGYRGRLINWERYCDGRTHELEQGVDFQGARVDSTRSAALQWAKRHGLKPRSAIVSPIETHADVADDLEQAGQVDFARRVRELTPRFAFQIVDGLSDEQVKLAKRLQQGDREALEELHKQRYPERPPKPPKPEGPDPVEVRRARLEAQGALAGTGE